MRRLASLRSVHGDAIDVLTIDHRARLACALSSVPMDVGCWLLALKYHTREASVGNGRIKRGAFDKTLGVEPPPTSLKIPTPVLFNSGEIGRST